jgi:nucleoside phosphorylase
MKQPPLRPEDFTVGWIAPLPVERAAAEVLLDERYEDCDWCHGPFVLGRVGGHRVVLGYLPAGSIGTNSAAVIATQMASTFKHMKIRMLVGIGGGVPSADTDIRLGDVVVSQPGKGHGGVAQYDFGKTVDGRLERTGHLNAPPKPLLEALAELQTRIFRRTTNVWKHLRKFDELPDFARTNCGPDILFRPESKHISDATCETCSQEMKDMVIDRPVRPNEDPVVHWGIIASGNLVMRHGLTRDQLSRELGGVLCFEMEAAGLLNAFPALTIRGISDYSDSHKHKSWQGYAAATAAACAREILSILPAALESKWNLSSEWVEFYVFVY